jgi:hypothetical protein
MDFRKGRVALKQHVAYMSMQAVVVVEEAVADVDFGSGWRRRAGLDCRPALGMRADSDGTGAEKQDARDQRANGRCE